MVGAAEIAFAIKLRKEIKGEWFLILMGLASIIFAVLLLWNPGPGALALLWLIGSYAIVLDILAIFFWLSIAQPPYAASILMELIETRLIPPETIKYTHGAPVPERLEQGP
jgi:hypothetical protein